MGMKRGRKKYATTWQKKVYFIDRSPDSAKFTIFSAKSTIEAYRIDTSLQFQQNKHKKTLSP